LVSWTLVFHNCFIIKSNSFKCSHLFFNWQVLPFKLKSFVGFAWMSAGTSSSKYLRNEGNVRFIIVFSFGWCSYVCYQFFPIMVGVTYFFFNILWPSLVWFSPLAKSLLASIKKAHLYFLLCFLSSANIQAGHSGSKNKLKQ
jgi:hypothetical protein